MSEDHRILDIIMRSISDALVDIHTAVIARVTDVGAITISCRPVVARIVRGEVIQLPTFVDVPPLFLQGGGSYTAHPISIDDYCILIISERCIDKWYAGQDYQPPLEHRVHDYSDAIAIVGINPRASAINIPAVIQQTGDANYIGNQTIVGDVIITGNLIVNGIVFNTHTHPGDSGGTTGVPNP